MTRARQKCANELRNEISECEHEAARHATAIIEALVEMLDNDPDALVCVGHGLHERVTLYRRRMCEAADARRELGE